MHPGLEPDQVQGLSEPADLGGDVRLALAHERESFFRCLRRPIDLESGRAALRPAFFDPAIAENTAKLDAVEQLIELATSIGCTLPQLAVAFTVAHPAVTSPIIGTRTGQQLEDLLKAPRSPWTMRPSTGSTKSCRPGRTCTTPQPHSPRGH